MIGTDTQRSDDRESSGVIYREVQRFSPRFLGAVWMFTALLGVVLALAAPGGNVGPALVLPLGALIFLALFYLAFTLRTEVRGDRVSVRLWPLPSRVVRTSDISMVDVAEYRPIRDFGGWGWRIGSKGMLYGVSGNVAVRLELLGKRPLYIGSSRPQALAHALQEATAAKPRWAPKARSM